MTLPVESVGPSLALPFSRYRVSSRLDYVKGSFTNAHGRCPVRPILAPRFRESIDARKTERSTRIVAVGDSTHRGGSAGVTPRAHD
jgi:hypothetical protein